MFPIEMLNAFQENISDILMVDTSFNRKLTKLFYDKKSFHTITFVFAEDIERVKVDEALTDESS